MTARDRVLCVLPLSFGYGLCQLLICVRVGATLVLEAGFAFPGRVVQLLEQHRITGLPGVPTIFQVLVSLRGLADRRAARPALSDQRRAGLCRRRPSARSAGPSQARGSTSCTG